MIAHPLGIMIRIGQAAHAGPTVASLTQGPSIQPAPALSASVLPAASAPEGFAHEPPSLDAAPSIGVPFAQHAVSVEAPVSSAAETASATQESLGTAADTVR